MRQVDAEEAHLAMNKPIREQSGARRSLWRTTAQEMLVKSPAEPDAQSHAAEGGHGYHRACLMRVHASVVHTEKDLGIALPHRRPRDQNPSAPRGNQALTTHKATDMTRVCPGVPT